MDEASRLITELQLKLAQLDHKICLYQQDMAAEFEKYTDDLLRGVPEEVSSTVNKAVAESMKSYQSLIMGSNDKDAETAAVYIEPSTNRVTDDAPTIPEASPRLPTSIQLPDPPDVLQNLHEREQEFQGLFTPSYLPLLDSTDRSERRSISDILSPPNETESLNIMARQKAKGDAGAISTSDPTSSTSLRSIPTLRRRSTDEGSSPSEQSDAPTRRSALRRKSSEAKPQSPRHVRFEFEGEEFPTTSSPKLDPDHELPTPVVPIILGNGDDLAYDGGSDQLDDIEDSPSPPRKRISSSEALRLLSRRPLEDNGIEWTEVRSPPDGSPSVPILGASDEDSEDDDVLSMQPMSVTAAAARSGRFGGRLSSPGMSPKIIASDSASVSESQSTQEIESKGDSEKTSAEVAEEQDTLSELAPLQPMGLHWSTSAIAAADTEKKLADKTQTVATEKTRSLSIEPLEGMEVNSEADLDIIEDEDDEDELFTFDEAAKRPNPPQQPDTESSSDAESLASDTAEAIPSSVSPHSTSAAQGITKPGTTRTPNDIPDNDPVTARATPSSQRNSVHPFNIPVVSPTIHAQAASLGDVTTFVGSIKDGLDEDALQSFKAGSLRAGATPRSLSEKMAFDDAMQLTRRKR